MDVNTILIISSLVFQLFAEIRRSRCTDIEISDCLKIHRQIKEEPEENNV